MAQLRCLWASDSQSTVKDGILTYPFPECKTIFQEISNSSSRRRMQCPQMESIFPVSKDSLQRYAASETAVPS